MIVCRKCSRRHADGTDFCVCGAFLEFDGERVADEGGPPPPSGARPAAPPPPAAPAPPPASSGWDSPPATRPTAEPAPWSGFTAEATPAETTTGSVRAQLPDAPLAPASAEPVDVRPTMRIGDVACTRCGRPNSPTRQFCQHCGHELATSRAAASAGGDDGGGRGGSWWQTFRRKLSRRGISTDPNRLASEVHMLSRGGVSGRSTLFRGGGIAILLGGMLAFLGPWRGTVTAWARDQLGASRTELVDLEPEQVQSVTAAPEPVDFPFQGPERTIDRHLNTSWATQWLDPIGQGLDVPPEDNACQTEERTGTFLRYTFADETDLAKVNIIPGRYEDDEQRATFVRPRLVELRWRDGDVDQCRYLELVDSGEIQPFEFEHRNVAAVEIRVVGVHADNDSQPTVDIAEVVFERDR